MIILLDTSTETCRLALVDSQNVRHDYAWEAGRSLSVGLLGFLRDKLAEHQQRFEDITAIGVMKGPGSFTGLRIGLTVLNTIANDREIPIVGVEAGDTWQDDALARLANNENDQIVLPEYGAAANITKPRK